MIIIQKKTPNTIVEAFSSVLFISVDFASGTWGIIERIKSQKKTDTISIGIHATPPNTGPNGLIQSGPAQVARKTIRKKIQSPRSGRRETADIINVNRNVKMNAPGMT